VFAPTIAIGSPDDPMAVKRAIASVREYAWIVFTSRNGVDVFFDGLNEIGRDVRVLGDVKIAAIGPRTAEALARRYVRVDFVPETYVNEAVAEGLLERTRPGDRVLLFRAQEARDVVPSALRAAGRVVDDVAAYATHTIDDPDFATKVAGADILTFTSSSTVNGFVANIPDVRAAIAGKTIACIGPITAATAREAGMQVDVIADTFTVDGLIGALGASVSA